MNFHKWKFLLLVFLLSACHSNPSKDTARTPAADPYAEEELNKFLAQDPFAKDGYDHNRGSARKFQPGKTLSKEQEIRELAGREIWFKSAPNERLHTYYFPQVLNSPIAWYKVLRADRHNDRFNSWGLINDPDCCVPGVSCDAKGMRYQGRSVTMEDTFGWEYCAGDEALLEAVRDPKANKWEDPACQHPVLKAADSLDHQPRENRCELAFGNPTGAVGYRKFPNPRFNMARWKKIGGWSGYEDRMKESDIDSSIEPPFRVGKSCASCHAAFDPLNPPTDLRNPTWAHIKGETGNQYLHISAILGSGTKHNTIEYQMFVHSRPGTADTSAVPNDMVNNPGTINAIINFPQRPVFEENVIRWNNVESCSGANCQVIPYANKGKKYWQKTQDDFKVMHILKGGEDSVGADLAVQRVYVNIGMCAEECWTTHLMNNRELDPTQRGYGQTPFNIQQCRVDCPSWRANEDRVNDVLAYLLSRRPTDLKDAKFKNRPEPARETELKKFLNQRYGATTEEDLVEHGKGVFAQNCAQCHSSQNTNRNDLSASEDFQGVDFAAKGILKDSNERIGIDWLGNDKSTPVDLVGTYQCRALHSNHLKGHIWEEFSSETYKKKTPVVSNLRTERLKGGRGYYRNISLLNLWAHAPFMHNNALGPEICGYERNLKFNPWRNTVEGLQTGPQKYTCESYFDPSVEGRLKLYEQSMDELLTPSANRRKKVAKTDEVIRMPLAVKLSLFNYTKPVYLEFPVGIPVNKVTSFDIKGFSADLMGALEVYEKWVTAQEPQKKAMKDQYDKYWLDKMNGDSAAANELITTSLESFETFKQMLSPGVQKNLEEYLAVIKSGANDRLSTYAKYYINCDAYYENLGHDFGTTLPEKDKNALKAFLATF